MSVKILAMRRLVMLVLGDVMQLDDLPAADDAPLTRVMAYMFRNLASNHEVLCSAAVNSVKLSNR